MGDPLGFTTLMLAFTILLASGRFAARHTTTPGTSPQARRPAPAVLGTVVRTGSPASRWKYAKISLAAPHPPA